MLVISVIKKIDSCKPENYRETAILSILGKASNKNILEWIREKTRTFTSNMQYGLRPHRGTIEAIFIIRQVM